MCVCVCVCVSQWPLLYEKAMARVAGGYMRMWCLTPEAVYMLITGFKCERVPLINPARSTDKGSALFTRVCEQILTVHKQPVVCTLDLIPVAPDKRKQRMEAARSYGLLAGHHYSVLAACTLQDGTRVVLIRDPHASDIDFKGSYGASSTESKSEELPRRAEQGETWITYDDMCVHFNVVYVPDNAHLFSYAQRKTLEGSWQDSIGGLHGRFSSWLDNPTYKLTAKGDSTHLRVELRVLVTPHGKQNETAHASLRLLQNSNVVKDMHAGVSEQALTPSSTLVAGTSFRPDRVVLEAELTAGYECMYLCVCVCVCLYVYICVFVCVCERERERE
jgi:hypothetical protein